MVSDSWTTLKQNFVVRPNCRVEVLRYVLPLNSFVGSALHRLFRCRDIRPDAIRLAGAKHIDQPNLDTTKSHKVAHVRRIHRHMVTAAFEVFKEFIK